MRTSFSSFSSACLWRRSSRFFFSRSTSFTTLLLRPRPTPAAKPATHKMYSR
jgi:hypothetical protein